MSLKRVVECIKSNKSFLITSHTNLEGDALGSELAFYRLLKSMGKQAIVVNDDFVSYRYGFLPDIDNIKRFKNNSKNIKFDCLAILDCSSLVRCGEVSKINLVNRHILNIDHHISNEKFGETNWVDPNASSASEMVYRIYKRLNMSFDKDTALLLYVGMLTDTGSFHYINTTSFTHKAISDLLKLNLNITQIYQNIYGSIPFAEMKLLLKILTTVEIVFAGKIACFKIKRDMLKNQKKLSFDLTENLLSFARAIKDIEVVVLFRENLGQKNEIRVNLRSQGKVDVNEIAAFFGGGGHKTASGATVRGKIDQVKKKVLVKIKESLKQSL